MKNKNKTDNNAKIESPSIIHHDNASQNTKNKAVRVMYQGPLPPASELARYNDVLPGLADRIVKMAENEQKHRHNIDETYLKEAFTYRRYGQIFAFIISIAAICAGYYAAINDHPVFGAIIGGGALASIVSIFVIGRNAEKSKDEEKN